MSPAAILAAAWGAALVVWLAVLIRAQRRPPNAVDRWCSAVDEDLTERGL